MKLVKRTTLHHQEGTSNRVYEVDLCQIANQRYVVNFRYGKRGGNLKEGTKTIQTIPLEEAQKVFDKLIEQKQKKGYADSVTENDLNKFDLTQPITVDDPQKQAVINRLADNQPNKWNLERAIWRAGELKIKEATPLLINLLGTDAPLRDYCIVWSLGWCGASEAIPFVTQLHQNSATPDFVRRIAFEALLKLADDATKANLQAQKIESLPPELLSLARVGSSESFTKALSSYLESGDYQNFAVLDTIYQVDNEYVRPALLNILRSAPFAPNYFQRIRHIFKIAEYRRDAEVFAILAYRFDKHSPMYSSRKRTIEVAEDKFLRKSGLYWDSQTKSTKEVTKDEVAEELKRPDAKLAYSTKTRDYFLRRLWRTLRKLGEDGDPDYVRIVIEILLQYSDADAEPVKESIFKRKISSDQLPEPIEPSIFKAVLENQFLEYKLVWDIYARYITFNHILYENSLRYELKSNAHAWSCREAYKISGEVIHLQREEAFPHLWEQNPNVLVKLLKTSNCRPVQNFAVKVLSSSPNFLDYIDISTIIELVKKPYLTTVQFAFDVTRRKYNYTEPNNELILALANCIDDNARAQALRLISKRRDSFLQDNTFIPKLITSEYVETRKLARNILNNSIISNSVALIFIETIIAKLLSIKSSAIPEYQHNTAKDLMAVLLINFTLQLRSLALNTIQQLIIHPLAIIQELGARILLNHKIGANSVPPELIASILESPHERVRVIGLRLFSALPHENLIAEYKSLILVMATNISLAIRNAIKPTIRYLASTYPSFNIQFALDLIEILLIPEKYEGVHIYLQTLLLKDLQGWTSSIGKETIFKLLHVKYPHAQELGGILLHENCQALIPELATSEIVKLANHEIFTVRQAATQILSQMLNRLRADSQDMLATVRLLDSKWDDSREFAFRVFTQELAPEEIVPEVVIAICDSVREDVRQLGRDLVTQNFHTQQGQEYLLKFSEHPSADMQLFASNFLEEYAVNNPERLRELMPFFIRVLSIVNRGSIVKKRIFAFLESEVQKSEAAATIVAEIMSRQSATIAIGNKSMTIQIMLKIRKKFPHISLPFNLKSVTETRSK
ncbi:WGR [Calothrix sp. PCC 7716]|nr:WGR [Calothrix sp. PCC 7716]